MERIKTRDWRDRARTGAAVIGWARGRVMNAVLDHLVVTAPTLAEGAAYVQERLGVEPRPGGVHPDMGTHNRLLRLDEGIYLEVIAIHPAGTPPQVPRWFDLDAAVDRARLATWVARTTDLEAGIAAAAHDPGPVRPMRRGALHWRIAFPSDGGLLAGGVLPPLIEWPPEATHPAERLPDDGLALEGLYGTHPQAATIRAQLAAIGLDTAIAVEAGEEAALYARIRTPSGRVDLE